MDVSLNTSSALSQATTNDAVSVAVLKKSIDAEASSAMSLINALPAPANLPPNLGRNINTVA